MASLVSHSGLPGVGKTTIARHLARSTKSIHLRVDTLEAALKRSTLKIDPAVDAGYLGIAALAQDNLQLGHNVIADTVNPIAITRQLWADTAAAANSVLLNVEIVCTDQGQHRLRVENRIADIKDHQLPDWKTVADRQFEPWSEPRLLIDSSFQSAEDSANLIAIEMKNRAQ